MLDRRNRMPFETQEFVPPSARLAREAVGNHGASGRRATQRVGTACPGHILSHSGPSQTTFFVAEAVPFLTSNQEECQEQRVH